MLFLRDTASVFSIAATLCSAAVRPATTRLEKAFRHLATPRPARTGVLPWLGKPSLGDVPFHSLECKASLTAASNSGPWNGLVKTRGLRPSTAGNRFSVSGYPVMTMTGNPAVRHEPAAAARNRPCPACRCPRSGNRSRAGGGCPAVPCQRQTGSRRSPRIERYSSDRRIARRHRRQQRRKPEGAEPWSPGQGFI